MEKTKVAIVDDHILIASALASMVESIAGYKVLFEAANGERMKEKMHGGINLPEIVLLDISMPEMDGFATAEWLRSHHPATLVMALTMEDDDEKIIRMIRSGAHGYLLKTIQPHELANALQQLLQNGYYYTGDVMKALRKPASAERIADLTQKENELLKLLCTEMPYKDIAAQLFLGVRTVEGYAAALMEKLGVKSRIGLVLLCAKKGLL
jgi:DNA-binding NarL/FixJ family response regulator